MTHADIPRDATREMRIANQIIPDTHTPAEQARRWYGYLAHRIAFPFQARCFAERSISPLMLDDELEVQALSPEAECAHEIFVEVCWQGHNLAVPLAQLAVLAASTSTHEAVYDWHYWVQRGYTL